LVRREFNFSLADNAQIGRWRMRTLNCLKARMKPGQPSARGPGSSFLGRDGQFLHLDPDEALSQFPVGQEQVQAYGFVRRSILI
jgi:hypothetical protein